MKPAFLVLVFIVSFMGLIILEGASAQISKKEERKKQRTMGNLFTDVLYQSKLINIYFSNENNKI